MPASILRKFFVGAAIACSMACSHAQEIGGRWQLHVMDLKHKVKVEATIRFAKEAETESCMGGQWKRVLVEAKTVSNEAFFPLAEPLAYGVNHGELTFGRTRVCDRYLFLSGKLHNKKINGNFHGPGPGYNLSLGYFSLTRLP